MYSDKRSILQLVALLKAHSVKNIVLCPGSRNAPIVQSICNDSFFCCHAVTDERSAGFVAMGIAQQQNRPTAVVCTSGTALLNLHPAVAEAYYQGVPLVVISGDRPASAVGQMLGQTLPQPGVFGTLVKCAINLPEIETPDDEWYCNRMLNEALLELNHHGVGPIHINVPISEPLFSFSTPNLPNVRVISRLSDRDEIQSYLKGINNFSKRMVIAGQRLKSIPLDNKQQHAIKNSFLWIAEYLANRTVLGTPINNFDAILYTLNKKESAFFAPNLLITYGGHIVSKRIKKFLKENPPKMHWHIATDGKIVDTYGCLTTVFEMSPSQFFAEVAPLIDEQVNSRYNKLWRDKSDALPTPRHSYSSVGVVGNLIQHISDDAVLHLANSSVIRYAQLFKLSPKVEVLCNRGTSGIEGSLSTAVGYAATSDKLNYLLIGDLSFFYDMNALWSRLFKGNFRILLINNSGGEIFKALPMNLSNSAKQFVVANHKTSAKGWAKECGFDYLSATDEEELYQTMGKFTNPGIDKPMFLEVFTDSEKDIELYKAYFHNLKK